MRYFDSHCDTVLSLIRGADLYHNDRHVSLEKVGRYDHYAQFFAMFVNMGGDIARGCKTEEEYAERLRSGKVIATPAVTEKYRALRDAFFAALDKNRDCISFCRSAADIDRAAAEGRSAALMSIEGAEQLCAMTLDEAYRDGVRMLTLTWNYRNAYGGSNITGEGLTEEGRALVKKADELGVIIDLSHGSDKLFWDVAEATERPFVCSHSNSRSVHSHDRNITDEEFTELVRRGGVTGINMCADFVAAKPVTIDKTLAHIEHFCALGGAKSIGIGGDLDGCDELPEGIGGVGDMYKLADGLARLGYSDEMIDDIFYGNLLRVVRAVVG